MDDFQVVIRQDGVFYDMSGRKLILWAAGSHARLMSAVLQLSDIALVVDSSPEVIGSTVVLYGQEYVVSYPEVLDDLGAGDYYILVGSTDFREEIVNQIYSAYGSKFPVCSRIEDFFRSYTSLEAMLLMDPVISGKIHTGNISMRLPDYISKLNNILRTDLDGIGFDGKFIPIKEGFRISFIVADKMLQSKYVVHFPTRLYREEYTPSDKKYNEEVYKCKELLKPDKLINIYEDAEGFEVEKFAETNIVWNDEMIRAAMKAIRQIHNSNIQVNVDRNPWNRLVHREVFLEKTKSYLPKEIKERVHSIIRPEACRFKQKLCHGDFHKNNVVLYKEQLVIIDWEWIGMSDPFLDICHFVNNLDGMFDKEKCTLEKGIMLYLQRSPSKEEICHAKAVSIMDLYMSYCVQLIHIRKRDKRQEEIIIRLIDEYEHAY